MLHGRLWWNRASYFLALRRVFWNKVFRRSAIFFMEGLVGIMIPAQFQGKLFSESNVRIFFSGNWAWNNFSNDIQHGNLFIGRSKRRHSETSKLRYSPTSTFAIFMKAHHGKIQAKPNWRHSWKTRLATCMGPHREIKAKPRQWIAKDVSNLT